MARPPTCAGGRTPSFGGLGECCARQASQAKVFKDQEGPDLLLAPAPAVPMEEAREHLADRIWRLHQSGARYGLQIQTISLTPSKGVRHRDACLEALATA